MKKLFLYIFLGVARTQKEEFNSVIQSNDGDLNSLFTNLTEFINK